MIDLKIFVYDMEELLLRIYWKSEKYKKAAVLRSTCGQGGEQEWRELGLGLRGQVIVLPALQPVPLNQLQRAGLELDKVFRLFIMGKRSEERVWSRVYSAVRGHVLAFVCEIGV
ncbi:hypothetical protein F2Q69_00022678 [Brassica cretica]|nr:hypothetical protein F2Q69_00022678 [Brassica cretica]